jgi:hydrogenase maturation protease
VAQHNSNTGCLLIGYGNSIRTDDRLGHYVVEQVSEYLRARLYKFRALTLPQLDVSLAEELTGTNLVIFIDARDDDSDELVRCEQVFPGPESPAAAHTTHTISIQNLLRTTYHLYDSIPTCYAVMPKGYDFSIGETLSPDALKSAEQARIQILTILHVPTS